MPYLGACLNCNGLGQADGTYTGDPGTVFDPTGGTYAGDPGTILVDGTGPSPGVMGSSNTGNVSQNWFNSLIGFGTAVAKDVTQVPRPPSLYLPPVYPGVTQPYGVTGSIYNPYASTTVSASTMLLLVGGLALVLAMRSGKGK